MGLKRSIQSGFEVFGMFAYECGIYSFEGLTIYPGFLNDTEKIFLKEIQEAFIKLNRPSIWHRDLIILEAYLSSLEMAWNKGSF